MGEKVILEIINVGKIKDLKNCENIENIDVMDFYLIWLYRNNILSRL